MDSKWILMNQCILIFLFFATQSAARNLLFVPGQKKILSILEWHQSDVCVMISDMVFVNTMKQMENELSTMRKQNNFSHYIKFPWVSWKQNRRHKKAAERNIVCPSLIYKNITHRQVIKTYFQNTALIFAFSQTKSSIRLSGEKDIVRRSDEKT